MSREALQESLSAVMDNEADELELRRVLTASDAAEVRATWSRYQIARAAMHKEQFLPHLDIAAGVSAALADEEIAQEQAKPARGAWGNIARLAVAASVTVAVLAGVRLYNQDAVTGAELAQQSAQPVLALPQTKGPAILAGYTEDNGAAQGATLSNVSGQVANWKEQGAAQQAATQSNSADKVDR